MADSDGLLGSLAPWSRTLWFVSGALGLLYASSYGAEAFLGTYPAAREFLGPVVYIVAHVALLGLYPVFADRQRWLARAGALFAVLGAAGYTLNLAGRAGVVSEEAAWYGASVLVLILAGMTLSFLAFGVASLRSEVYTRAVGVLLLAPVLVMGLNLGIVAVGLASPEGRLLASGLWALSFLAIGSALGSQDSSVGRAEPRPTEV